MKCYYEILEIAKEADDIEIKTSYRKLALKWHPDKNLDNSEAAKEQFQLVQQAYEVLSDKQERAWYDNHREQILRGSNSDFKDDSIDVFQYFTTQCYKGYGNEADGFYTIYRTLFEKIAAEDIEYMDSKSDFDEIPNFGNSNSDYENIVGPFYAYWSSYTTKKSYVWLDPYSINEARNGRVLKLIEKENKKVRQKAKKERNEEIRNLVAFVRKRDKRIQAHNKYLETKIVENRLKQEQLRKQKILENKKEQINHKSQAEWSKFDNVKHELKQIEKNLAEQFGECLSDSDESNFSVEDPNDNGNLYCVACNKVFKTPKAFSNHESSKKHRDNVELLKQTMLEEENELGNSSENELDNSDSVNILKDLTDLGDIQEELSDLNSSEVTSESKKKNKKTKKVIRLQKLSITEDSSEVSESETVQNKEILKKPIFDDDFDFDSVKKNKKKNAKQKTDKAAQENLPPTPKTLDEEETEKVERTLNSKKRVKKTVKKIAVVDISDLADIDITHCCVTCKTIFSSKNKLFDHLKKTGHSLALPEKVKKSRKKQAK